MKLIAKDEAKLYGKNDVIDYFKITAALIIKKQHEELYRFAFNRHRSYGFPGC